MIRETFSPCDLVLVEGYKFSALPKLEISRLSNGKGLLHPEDPRIVAIASDHELATTLPCFDLDEPARIATFITQYLELK